MTVRVTDETGLAGKFDLTNQPVSSTSDQFLTSIRTQLGLDVAPANDRAQIEFWVVEKSR